MDGNDASMWVAHANTGTSAEERTYDAWYIIDLKNAYNEDDLNKEAESAVAPFVKELEKAAENARKATVLHETAKQTFDTWRTGGFFERNKATCNEVYHNDNKCYKAAPR